MPSDPAVLSEQHLQRWIRDHQVCWEALPHREIWNHTVRTIGYDVVLTARCTGSRPCDPGGIRALALFRRLEQLARRVVPHTGDVDVTVGGFEPAYHLRPETHYAPEMSLVVSVRHRNNNYFEPVDAGELDGVRSVEATLSALGAQRGTWQHARPPQPSTH